jgi:hypothetical protein
LTLVEQFVIENYNPLKEAAVKITAQHELSEELLHYSLDEFLRKQNVEAIINNGGGRFYCVRIMLNSWRSTSSAFFYTYRKESPSIEEVVDVAIPEDVNLELVDKIKKLLKDLPWFDRMLFDVYVKENHSISSLSRSTGIPRTSVSLTINRVRKYIKKNL